MFAQQLNNSTFELAKMLAAPETGPVTSLAHNQSALMWIMVIGLVAMTIASIKFTHGVTHRLDMPDNF